MAVFNMVRMCDLQSTIFCTDFNIYIFRSTLIICRHLYMESDTHSPVQSANIIEFRHTLNVQFVCAWRFVCSLCSSYTCKSTLHLVITLLQNIPPWWPHQIRNERGARQLLGPPLDDHYCLFHSDSAFDFLHSSDDIKLSFYCKGNFVCVRCLCEFGICNVFLTTC